MTEAVSLGKGAWDCDANREIPPEKEVQTVPQAAVTRMSCRESYVVASHRNAGCAKAEVFEEIATMDFPFEGIPTVPPRKDMDHMVGPACRHLRCCRCLTRRSAA